MDGHEHSYNAVIIQHSINEEYSLFLPWLFYFLGLWQPVGEKEEFIGKTANGDAEFNEATWTDLWVSFLRVPGGGREDGGDGILSKFHTFACFVDKLLLEVINAQHRESRRGPIFQLHVC